MRLQYGNGAVDSSVNRGRRVQEGGVRKGRCGLLVIYALATAEAKPAEAGRCYERARADCELETLLSEKPTELNVRSHLHNRRPYRDPNAQPVKWMKLIQWWLVHRVPIDMIITPHVEAAACTRFKIPPAAWEEAKKRFPSLLAKVIQKRLRRIEYALQTGTLPPAGWTPPDPKNRSTQNVAPYESFWKH